jgi:hypothetical protein
MGITYLAEIVGELTFVSWTGQIWILPFMIYLNVVKVNHINKWVIWAVTSLLLSYPNGKDEAPSSPIPTLILER